MCLFELHYSGKSRYYNDGDQDNDDRDSENLGRGINLMREMHSIGFPYPHYSYDGVCLTLSIPLSKESLTTMFPQLKKLSPEELSIVEFIRENKMVTKAMVASKLNISEKLHNAGYHHYWIKALLLEMVKQKLPRNMAMLFQVLYLDGQHHGRFDYDQPISTK